MSSKRISSAYSSEVKKLVDQVLEEKEEIEGGTSDSDVAMNTRPRRQRTLSTKAIEYIGLNVSAELDLVSPQQPRRSGRKRRAKSYADFETDLSKQRKAKSEKSPDVSYSTDDGSDEDLEKTDKPETLFVEDLDVHGGQMYGFRTPKKRDGMADLASSTSKIHKTPKSQVKSGRKSAPNTPKTPSSRRSLMSAKTPTHVRSKLKNALNKRSLMDRSDESDFSADESDYHPESSESSASSESEPDEFEEVKAHDTKRKSSTIKSTTINYPMTPTTRSLRPRGRPKKDVQYVLDSEAYFQSHTSSKVVTSDHTLDRLKNPRLEHDKLFKLLSQMSISSEHERAVKDMHEEYKQQFMKWLFLMNEGFNIMVYGLGSKRNLLNTFHKEVLKDKPVIVINGFFPSLTLKDIFDAIISDILDITTIPAGHHEAVDLIETEFNKIPEVHLFLIVHNLDGVMLRNERSQSVLSKLASCQNIHLIASIDHINTPLIWDNSKLTNYNFSWWDCTTMLPYKDETAYENSMLVQNSGALALSSMRNVFQSLTTNGRGIYVIIVQSQINNKGNPSYQGMAFKDLYSSCREAFLVSSDLALRAQLTEFLDHKLVKLRRLADGAEYLQIPLDHVLLQQFLEEQKS